VAGIARCEASRADHDTLCGWGDRGKVAWFVENAETVIPQRLEQLRLLAELIPSPRDAEIEVLDLGAGFGAVTEPATASARSA